MRGTLVCSSGMRDTTIDDVARWLTTSQVPIAPLSTGTIGVRAWRQEAAPDSARSISVRARRQEATNTGGIDIRDAVRTSRRLFRTDGPVQCFPEPSTLLLAGVGLLGVLARRPRRKA